MPGAPRWSHHWALEDPSYRIQGAIGTWHCLCGRSGRGLVRGRKTRWTETWELTQAEQAVLEGKEGRTHKP